MKSSWEYYKGVRKFYVFFWVFLAARLFLALVFPEMLRNITRMITEDALEGGVEVSAIVMSGLTAFGLVLLVLLCTTLAEYFSSLAIDHYSKNLRNDMFEKIQRVETERINEMGTATLLPIVMNDTNWLKNWKKRFVLIALYVPINIIGGFVMLYLIRPEYALIALCSMPLIIAFFFISARVLDKTVYHAIATFDAIYHNTKEGIIGAKEIRIFNKSEERAAEFDRYITTHRKQDIQTLSLFNISTSFHTVLFTVIAAAIILFGALTRTDVDLLSDLNAAIMYIDMIWTGSLFVYQNTVDYIPRTKYTVRRIDKLFDLPEGTDKSGIKAEPAARERFLEFENVNYVYSNNENGLTDLSFVVERGMRVAIVGGVGSGKNLVPQIILQTHTPTSGRVMISEMDISAINKTFFRKNVVSLCAPDPEFMPGTIRDNLKMLSPESTDEQIISTFHELGLESLIAKFGTAEDFLNFVMSERTSFNDATKNLLNIVRSILKPASIYVFNQCFNHVKQEYIVKLLAKLKREKRTCLFVDHKLWICRHVNKVYVMKGGRINGVGTHEKLAKSNKVYKDIFAIGGGDEFAAQDDITQKVVQEVSDDTEQDMQVAEIKKDEV